MKPMKLTSLVVMLLVGFSAAAQEEFFDDVYFSSSKEKKKEKTEERLYSPKKKKQRSLHLQLYWHRLRIHIRRLIKIEMWMNIIVDIHLLTLRNLMMRTWMKRTVLISKSYLITIRK